MFLLEADEEFLAGDDGAVQGDGGILHRSFSDCEGQWSVVVGNEVLRSTWE